MNDTCPLQTDFNTLSSNDFRLITLGRLALLHPDGREDESLGKRKRKLAVLAVLAVTRKPHTREALAEMFWGDQEDAKAKHSLSDVLSNVRRVINPDCILTNQSRIELAPDVPLTVDANELTEAAAKQRWSRVVELYGGDFLDGVHVAGSNTFDAWVSREGERLRQLFLRACERRTAILAEDSAWDACARIAERWLEADPLSADAALTLLGARQSEGTLESYRAALSAYAQLNARLLREYDAEPDNRVASLAATIARAEEVRAREQGTPALAAAPPSSAAAMPGSRVRRRVHPLTAALLALALLGMVWFGSWRTRPRPSSRASVAIVDIQSLRGDSADTWLEQGLPQMIAADLSRNTGIDVVAPERVRQVRARAAGPQTQPLSLAQVLSIGKSVGASTIVSGGFTHGNGAYVLDLTIHDARTGDVVNLFTLTDTSVLRLADAAAARLAGATTSGQGPQFAEIETRSLQAYQHYVRAQQEGEVGRFKPSISELDAAIALDSGLVPALVDRLGFARAESDTATERILFNQIARHPERGTEYDRLTAEILRAEMVGERSRTLALARSLARRYPRDPRTLYTFGAVLSEQGRFAAADSVFRSAIALDSLGMESGLGPCAPCAGYGGLAALKQFLGDEKGAEALVRRWIALQPDAPTPWGMLGDALRYQQRFTESYDAYRRAVELSSDVASYRANMPRVYLEARRYEAVDSALADWGRDSSTAFDTRDVAMMLQRERGQFRRALETARKLDPDETLGNVTANSLSRLGRYDEAVAIYERAGHPSKKPDVMPGVTPNNARVFSWIHALEADAIAPAGDTVRLHALADSIAAVSQRSYYGRDWRLHHHILGLIAMQGHRYADAIREFQQARWGGAGWTVTVADIARSYLALNRPSQAVDVLRDAYKGPLDAMGRYAPRSELDFLMALAFQQAGQRDSAAVYARYVRKAWEKADPEIKRQLSLLP